jgi:4-amino-4-deoxy-L-arabinose transferase-like glycosyltransferase
MPMARLQPLSARIWAVPLAIVALAAALRLWAIEFDAQNPFYDAAVHSMGLSWHNFFFGALDPSARLAIDKPPVDLWLQVASTKLLGFNRTALALPEALGGIAAVGLLYGAVTCACGRLAGALAALTLAVLPIAVLTSRSDTMDSVMSALLIAALWSSVMAVRTRQVHYVLAGAALVGVAFDVKLGQALVPLPALALMWWAASRPPVRRRIALAAASVVALVVVAMTWAFTASLTPLSARPFPIGSRTGSIYSAMFVYNGIERLTGKSRELTPYGFSSPAGLGRLLGYGRPHYAMLIGLMFVAALVLLIATGMLWLLDRDWGRGWSWGRGQSSVRGWSSVRGRSSVRDRSWGRSWSWGRDRGRDSPVANHHGRSLVEPAEDNDERAAHWLVAALLVWLVTGYVLFSFMGRLQPRYLEAMSPAVAAMFGIASASLLMRIHLRLLPRVPLALLTVSALALLSVPAEASVDLVEERASDANPTGSGGQFSAYLRAHRDGARYEAAAANPLSVVGMISQDAQPVLILRSVDGILVSVGELRQLVSERAVRYVILPHPCSSGRHCTPTTAWSVRNSVKVRQGLYRYLPPSKLH